MDKIDGIKATPDYHTDQAIMMELFQLESRLDEILRTEMEGVILRSKATFVEKGERCTKYFFGLEKNNGKKKMVNKLLDEATGESLLTQDKISEHAVSFFQNVYSTAHHSYTDRDTYLEDCSVNKIPHTLSDDLDQPITMEEMETVIKNLKSNKSPG